MSHHKWGQKLIHGSKLSLHFQAYLRKNWNINWMQYQRLFIDVSNQGLHPLCQHFSNQLLHSLCHHNCFIHSVITIALFTLSSLSKLRHHFSNQFLIAVKVIIICVIKIYSFIHSIKQTWYTLAISPGISLVRICQG